MQRCQMFEAIRGNPKHVIIIVFLDEDRFPNVFSVCACAYAASFRKCIVGQEGS